MLIGCQGTMLIVRLVHSLSLPITMITRQPSISSTTSPGSCLSKPTTVRSGQIHLFSRSDKICTVEEQIWSWPDQPESPNGTAPSGLVQSRLVPCLEVFWIHGFNWLTFALAQPQCSSPVNIFCILNSSLFTCWISADCPIAGDWFSFLNFLLACMSVISCFLAVTQLHSGLCCNL